MYLLFNYNRNVSKKKNICIYIYSSFLSCCLIFFCHIFYRNLLLTVLMSSLYRGLNTYILPKLRERLASVSANSFPIIPT